MTYNKTFDDVHNLDVLAGHENYNYKYQYLYGQREKLYNPNVPELDNGISNQYNSSYSKDYATEGSIRIIVGVTFGLSVQVGY